MCHLLLSQIEREAQDKLKIARPLGKTCGTCDFFETDGTLTFVGTCSKKQIPVSKNQLCNLGVQNMEFVELAQIATALVVVAGTVYKYAASKYGKEIQNVETSLKTIGDEKILALEAINEMKSLLENCKTAGSDGKITAEEMEKIYVEMQGIINCSAVSKLLKKFDSE